MAIRRLSQKTRRNESAEDILKHKLEKILRYIDEDMSKNPKSIFIANLIETSIFILTGEVVEEEPEEDDDEENAPRSPRNLRAEMAGNLPPVRDVGKFRDTHGLTGGNAAKFKVLTAEETPVNGLCPECQEAIETHPSDENSPSVAGKYPHILCDRTRCYW